MSRVIEDTSEQIARTMATPERGFVEWLPLIMPIVTQALQCLFHNDDVEPSEVQSRVEKMNAKNPKRLHRRMKRNALAVARREGKRLTDAQADQVATEAIDACLQSSSDIVEAAGREAQAADWSAADLAE
jgi:hypothetical protein